MDLRSIQSQTMRQRAAFSMHGSNTESSLEPRGLEIWRNESQDKRYLIGVQASSSWIIQVTAPGSSSHLSARSLVLLRAGVTDPRGLVDQTGLRQTTGGG